MFPITLLFQSEVTLDDIFSFLMHFRADESLCRGTQLWSQVRCITHGGGLYQTCNETACWSSCMTDLWWPWMFLISLQLCNWLLDNEGSFKPRIIDGDCTGTSLDEESVRAYVQDEMLSYLRVPASTGNDEFIYRNIFCRPCYFYMIHFKVVFLLPRSDWEVTWL